MKMRWWNCTICFIKLASHALEGKLLCFPTRNDTCPILPGLVPDGNGSVIRWKQPDIRCPCPRKWARKRCQIWCVRHCRQNSVRMWAVANNCYTTNSPGADQGFWSSGGSHSKAGKGLTSCGGYAVDCSVPLCTPKPLVPEIPYSSQVIQRARSGPWSWSGNPDPNISSILIVSEQRKTTAFVFK